MIIIDRIEGDFAVCERDGEMINIKISLIEDGVSEGDIIELCGDVYKKNSELTEKRKRRATALLEKLKNG